MWLCSSRLSLPGMQLYNSLLIPILFCSLEIVPTTVTVQACLGNRNRMTRILYFFYYYYLNPCQCTHTLIQKQCVCSFPASLLCERMQLAVWG